MTSVHINDPAHPDFQKADSIDYFEGYSPSGDDASVDIKERLLNLVDREVQLDAYITTAKVALIELEEKLKKLRREELPELLDEMGQEECRLADGRKVGVARKVNGTVKEQNRAKWFEWLEETKNDGIIKTKVVSEFGRGELDEAKKAKEALQKAGYMSSLDQSIHAMTQSAFIREHLAKDQEEEGYKPLPDCVDLFEFREAKVTQPKDPAKRKKK